MSYSKLDMLNKKAAKAKPGEIMEALDVKPGSVVADVGAGGGYYTFLFSEKTGINGLVYAVDSNPEALKKIRGEADGKKINNIRTLAPEGFFALPKEGIDLIYMRNVYHHLKNRVEYFTRIRDLLKPDGLLAVIEYKKTASFSFHNLFGHHTKPEDIKSDLIVGAGYLLEKEHYFLPDQSFIIFRKNKK